MRDVAYIALGSNLGDREGYLSRARAAIDELPHTRIVRASSVEETLPLGGLDQPPYLNQMIAVETTLAPRELLARLHELEVREGRRRDTRWGSRTIDLDIVCFDQQTVNEPDLQVPHPGLETREFWRRELAELRVNA